MVIDCPKEAQWRSFSEGRNFARIREALGSEDEDVLAEYGGFNAALQHLVKLQELPEARGTERVSIDDYATWMATRFAGVENGFVSGAEDS